MTSQPWKQTIAIHILSNISRSKGNQKMKFRLLVEYNMRNIFSEKLYAKCGGETSHRLFSKKIKIEHICESALKFLLLYVQVEGY